ncbi:esterase family protein, partial [Streptomyces coelicoflavus ZG0656]
MKPGVLGLLLALGMTATAAQAQTAPQTPAPAETPIVIGRSYALPSAVMGATREINVWLPPGYAGS